MANSVIFIGSPEKNPKNFKKLLLVSPYDVFFRIFAAFIPPLTKKYQKVYIDLQGPLLAILLLVGVLNYGYSFKTTKFDYSPTEAVLIYSVAMPLLCFILCKIGRSRISLSEAAALIGYGLYGHVITLIISYLFFKERSNFFFFVCLSIFGGLTTLRIALVVLATLVVPAARLLICSVISIINVLFLIFIHFAYMHPEFPYRD